jgi:predicted transcriptional regulator
MGELILDIQTALEEGNLSFREIAYRFEVPYDWVVTIAEEMAEEEAE